MQPMTSADGTRIAYNTAGEGTPVVDTQPYTPGHPRTSLPSQRWKGRPSSFLCGAAARPTLDNARDERRDTAGEQQP
jgi:hypothetical protein